MDSSNSSNANGLVRGLLAPLLKSLICFIGLWKAFKYSSSGRYETDHYPQAYLKGHTATVSLIEVRLFAVHPASNIT
jgi:hypothetical protein